MFTRPKRSSSLLFSAGVALCVSPWLAGCANSPLRARDLNGDTGPGAGIHLDTLEPTAAAEIDAKPYSGPSPSVVSVTRENWQTTSILVPVTGVYSHPNYTDDKPRFARRAARSRGEYPTQVTALEGGETSNHGGQMLEGFAAPVRAAWDIVRFPVWVFRKPPWAVVQSPLASQPFQRRPLESRNMPLTGSPVRADEPAAPSTPGTTVSPASTPLPAVEPGPSSDPSPRLPPPPPPEPDTQPAPGL